MRNSGKRALTSTRRNGWCAEVDRVLGRPRGIRIGEAPDRDGQYFHYLAMWLYALSVLAGICLTIERKGVELVRQIHDRFVVPGVASIWKMKEDLSGPYPGYGFGALDAFDGYVSYRLLDEEALAREIADMQLLIDAISQRPCHHPGSGSRHDAMADPLFPRRGLGATQRRVAWPCSIGCGSRTAIFAASRGFAMSNLPSPITASRSACRR